MLAAPFCEQTSDLVKSASSLQVLDGDLDRLSFPFREMKNDLSVFPRVYDICDMFQNSLTVD